MKIINLYTGLCLAAALWLASCDIGKKYTRPTTDLPTAYRMQSVAVTADTVLLPWRTFFKDPALVGLIERALQKNNEIAVALLNMQQLELAYSQAKQTLLPMLNFSAGANRNWFSQNSLNGSLGRQFLGSNYMDNYDATLQLSWEIDIWRKAKMQKESALANYFAQKENLAALRTRLIAQVAQAYYNLLAFDAQLHVSQRNISLSDSTLHIIRLQYQAGAANSLAVEQAELQKKTAELLIPTIRQAIAIQENALQLLCGAYPDSLARVGDLAAILPEAIFPTGVPALLLSRRPDVRAAEYVIVSANARTGLAKAAMYPTIGLTPSIGTNALKIGQWFDIPGSIVKNFGFNLAQPILQRKALQTAWKTAQLEQEKAVVQFKQVVLLAVGEVSDALVKIQYADERLAIVNQKTASFAKSANDALLLYQNGMATYLEVITVHNNALQNDLEAINIQRDKLLAIVDLYRALGGGADN